MAEILSDDAKKLIGIGAAVKDGAKLIDEWLATPDGEAAKARLVRELRKRKAFLAADLAEEAHKIMKAVVACGGE